jgi:5-hydroxyisourate hydrolase
MDSNSPSPSASASAAQASAGGISLHAVDVARGMPAAGMRVELWRVEPAQRVLVAHGTLAAAGQLDHPCARGQGVTTGCYEALFFVREWLQQAGQHSPFLDVVPFRFELPDATTHVHLPFKFTPWGFSLFRGH